MTLNQIREAAQEELAAEALRAAIDAEKARLRSRKWWHAITDLIPFTIQRKNPHGH